MAAESSPNGTKANRGNALWSLPLWMGIAIAGLLVVIVVLLGLLAVSIMERRWEAQRPAIAVQPVGEWEMDSEVWGRNYPNEYESYLRTRIADTETKYGGSYPRDYLKADPRQVILFAGYGFSKDYRQARGHYWAVEDVSKTARLARPFQAATCWSCKSPDVPRLMNTMGVKEFYAANFHDLSGEVTHPIGCHDCHDPQTLKLRITRPALKEAFAAMGKDINQATHQEMRAFVCGQCHVEYHFKGPEKRLTFPWSQGLRADQILAYYNEAGFKDWTHGISGAPALKAQHPEFETWNQGIHARSGVACADCHMPYMRVGAMKISDHHVRSPLLNINRACQTCHRWSEDELRDRAENIQSKTFDTRGLAMDALIELIGEIGKAREAGATDQTLALARDYQRKAQFLIDFVEAENSMGFHAPQEAMRLLSKAIDFIRRGQGALRAVAL